MFFMRTLENSALTSAFDAEATTFCIILHRFCTSPFSRTSPGDGFSGSLAAELKNSPPALLHPSGAVRYNTSLWMWRIMLEA
eukprot:7897360-Ditylum_brightwellii.AAC.1